MTESSSDNSVFQIKKWNLIASWRWTVETSDVCAICRAQVLEACVKCQAEDLLEDCSIVWGACSHSFHNCCMTRWTSQSKRCPLCQQEWKNSKTHQIDPKTSIY